ncbi:LOW QUALITY PROTEIN: muscleblind-like protein 1 [Palaemon carinicauda]|uniref:LOW QUALITY PROTEIN: muscleblind-like protein 1 n=1 Tax=Palaemon carinicauda TaxID=392227 RepID=UPI0035B5748C
MVSGVPNMAMVNVNNFLNVKDSRWLQLEVCREFQRNKCTRPDTECKFAHPPPNVEVQNGRVTACYDSIKGRCNREKPPCKYFHPPQHLKDQLLINGRNHLALKNAIMTQIQGLSPGTAVVQGTIPVEQVSTCLPQIQQQYYPSASSSSHSRQDSRLPATQPQYNLYNTAYSSESVPLMLAHNSPYLPTGVHMNFSPYVAPSPVMPMGISEAGVPSPLTGVVSQQVLTAQKVPRTDRLEVCREFQRGACKRPEQECRFAHPPDHVSTTDEGTVTVCMDAIKSRCSRDPCRYFHPPPHLQAQLRASQGRAAQQPVPGAAVAAAAAAVPLAPPPPLPAAAAAAAAAAELGKKRGRDPSDELLMAIPGIVPYKRPAGDKSGVPVYQPTGNAAYQQALMQQLGTQSFVPVSCEYGGSVPLAGVGGQADSQDTTAANNHAAASSAQPVTTSSSSSITTTTNSPTTVKAICSTPVTASSSSSLSLSGTGGDTASVSPVPLPSQPAVNVFSYTGYALSKGLRPQFKPQATPTQAIMGPSALSTGFGHPMLHPGQLSNLNYGVGAPMHSIGVSPYMTSNQHLMHHHGMTGTMGLPHGISGMTAGMAPSVGSVAASLGGIGSGVPVVNPSLLVPHIPTSLYLPQYTALSSNTQYSLAQGGEQPYKKLKTS